ncbi:MAG: diphthamide biosynthesis enzyme Dph2 [Nitrososphaerota archaeon]|jgi:2-(3-amino-3-carboxypropyl)histidine synthase|nr:diphthamide biosynthesis enzyme Dph2 [Nitrososphaerota archaeon]MDG6945302.1 diphthamide biosynthesis enzyme Dph2 [Nitrososphaerota archaeon]MDG6949042.1 diphthamide biosynthesis enzyme Dph2 [Nitrososphaerota archaeon]
MTVKIDENEVFRIIEDKRPRVVLVNAPGGLLRQTKELMEKVKERYGVTVIMSGDSCFGVCDTIDDDVEKLQADLALHIGHNAAIREVGNYTYLIDAVDDVEFGEVVETAVKGLAPYKRIGLATFSQHLHQLGPVKEKLEAKGFHVVVGRRNNLMLEGQVFGCDFSAPFPTRSEVDAFVFLGESEFHAVGLALSMGKPTFMLDPYTNEVTDMQAAANERKKRAILAVYKARDARVFGVITGLKEGQKMLGRSNWITKRLEMNGKKVVRLAMRDITTERLAPHREIEAFVQTACPRISVDGFTFDRPVLSIPQADALVALIEGRDPGEFLERAKWIELTVGLIKQ